MGRGIVCSGHVEDTMLPDDITREDVKFLPKPFSNEALLAMLDPEPGRAR